MVSLYLEAFSKFWCVKAHSYLSFKTREVIVTIDEIPKTYCAEPPSATEWAALRDTFTGLGNKLYNGDIKKQLPEHFKALERELERCYCSSAFISCISLSYSIVETFLFALTKPERAKLNDQLVYVEDDVKWLKARRNDLSHFGRPSNNLIRVTTSDERSSLESDARKAIALVYHVGRVFSRL
jgi:hypothetical protein